MAIEIIAPLVAESTILEFDIDQKIMKECRGSDMVFRGQCMAIADRFSCKNVCLLVIYLWEGMEE